MIRRMTKPNSIIKFSAKRYINLKDGSATRMRKSRKYSRSKKKTLSTQSKLKPIWHFKALFKVRSRTLIIKIIINSVAPWNNKSTTTMIISKQLWWKYRTTSGTTKSGPRSTTRIRTAICSKVRSISWRGTRWGRRATWAGMQPRIAHWTVTT